MKTRHTPRGCRISAGLGQGSGAFTSLIEARAHARERPPGLGRIRRPPGRAKKDSGDEPAWIDFHAHSGLSADAAEIFRDLKNPKTAIAWNKQAAAMPPGAFTRSVDILARVQLTRAKDYVRELNTALAPWRREPAVLNFVQRIRKDLGVAA